jgi:hypothetical protein
VKNNKIITDNKLKDIKNKLIEKEYDNKLTIN